MMKKFIYLFLIALSSSAMVNAQEEEAKVFDIGIAIVPQYAFVSTMRLDVDLTLKKNNIITIAPMFSFSQHSSFSDSEDYYYNDYESNYPRNIELIGAGLKLTFRHFFGEFKNNAGVYAGGGLHYRYSQVEYQTEDWLPSVVDGDNYLNYGFTKEKDSFNQLGVDFIFGYQMYLVDNLYADVFAGWGFRISDADRNSDDYWSDAIIDIAYSGYMPLAGLRIGIFF